MSYRRLLDENGDVRTDCIFEDTYNLCIPCVEDNYDYQAFLTYLADNELTFDDIPIYQP